MKKRILVLLMVAVLAFSVVAFAACDGGNGSTKVAYGLVHGKHYVGQAKLVYNGDKLVDADIDEACFPTQVTATEASTDTVTVGEGTAAKHYYKTVKWADVTAVHGGEDTYDYVINGDKKIMEYFADEANCQKYFEAVVANEISVVVGGADKKDIMTAAKLLKSLNNYWAAPNANAPTGWAQNVRQTCAFVVINGFDFNVADITVESKVVTVKVGGVATVVAGSTWTDAKDYFAILKLASTK